MSDEAATEAPPKRKRGERGPDKRPRKRRGAPRELPPQEGTTPAPRPAAASKPAPASSMRGELRLIAAEYLVSILWGLSWALSFLFGARLSALSKEELQEGRDRALPLLEGFPVVASVLSFAGLPVWLVRKVAEHLTFPKSKPPPAVAAPKEEPPVPKEEAPLSAEELAARVPSNVVHGKWGGQ